MSVQDVREYVEGLEARVAAARADGKRPPASALRELARDDLRAAEAAHALGFEMGTPALRDDRERDRPAPLWFWSGSETVFRTAKGWCHAYRIPGLPPEHAAGHRHYATPSEALEADFSREDRP